MNLNKNIFLIICLSGLLSCQQQANSQATMTSSAHSNPLLCDPETGVCELPSTAQKKASEPKPVSQKSKLTLLYFTDPICSACWGLEPQLRKLLLTFGEQLSITYVMGGLLPDWNYNAGGISKPSDVAHHWEVVSKHYDMPIDGDLWLEDPLNSSYPPSIAYKAVALQEPKKAKIFLRQLREMVFMKKINIAKLATLKQVVHYLGLDSVRFEKDYHGKAKELFERDLALTQQYGVRGFPTLILQNPDGSQERVGGAVAYAKIEKMALRIAPNLEQKTYGTDWEALFNKYKTLTAREFSEIGNYPREDAEWVLNRLTKEGKLSRLETKNGALWEVKE